MRLSLLRRVFYFSIIPMVALAWVASPALGAPRRVAQYYAWYDQKPCGESWPPFYCPPPSGMRLRPCWWPVQFGDWGGLYKSDDERIVRKHIRQMQYGKIDIGIIGYAPGLGTVPTFENILSTYSTGTTFKWCPSVWSDKVLGRNATPAQIESTVWDLWQYYDRQSVYPGFYREANGTWYLWVYNRDWRDSSILEAWRDGLAKLRTDHPGARVPFIMMRSINDYANTPIPQQLLDSGFGWYNYATGTNGYITRTIDPRVANTCTVSPGFWLGWDLPTPTKFLPRAPGDGVAACTANVAGWKASWDATVQKMVSKTGMKWHMITSFNEWREGTSIEDAPDLHFADGSPKYGIYLNSLSRDGK